MKITFYSNFLNHHQLEFCKEMYKRLGDNFKFVATEIVPEERLKMGYYQMDNNYPFLIKAYENENEAIILSDISDIVILGAASEKYVKDRLEKNKFVFRYNERFLKRGQWRIISPRTLKYLYKYHTKYRNSNAYMLCASAYTANDFSLVWAYKYKMYKWGYFPEVKNYDLAKLFSKKNNKVIKILWVGRFINWKHPEKAIEIAKRLKRDGYDFNLTMIGIGKLENKIKQLVESNMLSNYVTFLGSMSPEEVRKYMEQSNIFLFTSDYNEGWGAVLNEAMNSGCAVVASHAIGSVPFLINHCKNGLIYKNGSISDLYYNVKLLVTDRELCNQIGIQAYNTMINTWNPKVATENLLALFESIIKNEKLMIKEGPCSIANPIRQKKMYNYCINLNN